MPQPVLSPEHLILHDIGWGSEHVASYRILGVFDELLLAGFIRRCKCCRKSGRGEAVGHDLRLGNVPFL